MIATSLLQVSLVSAQQDVRGFQAVKGFYDQSWALLVGINKYKRGNNLNFAVNDVNRTRKVLVNRFGFREKNILALLDEQATKKNIEDAMSKFADPDSFSLLSACKKAFIAKKTQLEGVCGMRPTF